MMRPMNSQARPGVTLLEVLTAMFIMAIGMLALLTLFPLGALYMAQALRDDRATSAANNAASNAVGMDIRNDASVISFYTNPNGNTGAAPNTALVTKGLGFPVFVDAYGTNAALGALTGSSGALIARTSLSFVTNSTTEDRWFSLLDDLTFTPSGLPAGATASVERSGKHTWAYLLQPLDVAEGLSTTNTPLPTNVHVNLYVVEYEGRSIGALGPETFVTGSGVAGSSTITLNSAAQIRRGGWIFDATIPASGNAVPQGNFYQVINVDPSGTTVDVQPLLQANITQMFIMNDVYSVFYRGSTPWRQ